MSIDGLAHKFMNAFRQGDIATARALLPSLSNRTKSKSLIDVMYLIWDIHKLHGQQQIINLLHAHNQKT